MMWAIQRLVPLAAAWNLLSSPFLRGTCGRFNVLSIHSQNKYQSPIHPDLKHGVILSSLLMMQTVEKNEIFFLTRRSLALELVIRKRNGLIVWSI